jgi:predicted GNAT family acetyltransferase
VHNDLGRQLQVTELGESSIPALEAYLRKELPENLYLIYDLQYERESRAAFHIAIEDESILGVLLKYRGYPYSSTWILGSDEAVRELLDEVGREKTVLLTTPELSKTVEEKFPTASKYEMNIMALDASAAKPVVRHNVRRLGVDDAYAWARSVAYRVGENLEPAGGDVVEAQRLLAKNAAFGIVDGGLLVSRATSHVRLPEAWAVGGIFTDPRYRERGLATSATSALVREALQYTGRIVLFVRSDNAPANHLYEKIGFRNIAKRRWLDTGTGITP